MSVLDRILGSRPPKGGRGEEARRYQLPTWLFAGAAGLLLVSLLLPYWVLNLKAPQFPQGLQVRAYVNRLVGDIPKPVITDEHPLVDRPVLIPLTISAQGSSTPALALISALMVIAGGAVVAFPSRRRRPTFLASPART